MKWPNKKYKIGENHLCRSVFLVTQISQMTQIFSHGIFLFIGCHGIYSEISCWDDYSRIFADATCPVVADTPWEWKMSHRFHRYTQIFLGTFFCHADFADDADSFSWDFFIGCHGIYSEISCCGDYSRIFADATCPVVADTPWGWTKRFTRDSIKNLCKSVKSVGQNLPHE